VADVRVLYIHEALLTRAGEVHRKVCGIEEEFGGWLLVAPLAYDDVGALDVARVEPQVRAFRHAERELVVLGRGAPDEDLAALGADEGLVRYTCLRALACARGGGRGGAPCVPAEGLAQLGEGGAVRGFARLRAERLEGLERLRERGGAIGHEGLAGGEALASREDALEGDLRCHAWVDAEAHRFDAAAIVAEDELFGSCRGVLGDRDEEACFRTFFASLRDGGRVVAHRGQRTFGALALALHGLQELVALACEGVAQVGRRGGIGPLEELGLARQRTLGEGARAEARHEAPGLALEREAHEAGRGEEVHVGGSHGREARTLEVFARVADERLVRAWSERFGFSLAAAQTKARRRGAELDPRRAARGAQIEGESVRAEPNFLNEGAFERRRNGLHGTRTTYTRLRDERRATPRSGERLNRLGYPAGAMTALVPKALFRALVVAEGSGSAEVFLRESGVEAAELEDETVAIPLIVAQRLLKRFAERRGHASIADLAPILLEAELLAAWVPVLRGVEHVADALARVGSAESDQRRTQRWETLDRGDAHWVGKLLVQHDPELEADGVLAAARVAMLRAVPAFFGLPVTKSVELGPLEKGEVSSQVYRVRWGAAGLSAPVSTALGAASGGALGAVAPLALGPSTLAYGVAAGALLAGSGVGAFLAREARVRARAVGEKLRRSALERKIALEETRAKQGAAGLEGQLLAGTYRVRRRMGSGASGVVYEAVRTSDGRPVAMKLLLASSAHDSVASDRLRREAEALGLAWHPNVVEVLDQGQLPDGTIYLVMELLEGDSLAHRLRRDGPFRPNDLVPIATELAGALEAIHAAGVIHRDLKPENVFLVATPEGGTRPKILDFGIARVEWAETRITVNGVPMGTPGYMAPEQERGGEVDARADIFAFGAMLYECLTGDAPAPLTASFHVRISGGEALSWENLRWPHEPTVSEGWRRLVERAMNLDPNERFQDARELLEALRAIEPDVVEDEFPLLAE
jgi:hypothetical protein